VEQRNSRLFLLLIYFALAIYILPTFSHTADELTNWATAASLVEKNSFDISPQKDLIGENTDIVKIGEKVYSKNPPGIALSASPFYAMTRIFIGESNSENIHFSLFIMRFFVSTLPLFFLAVWLYQKDIDDFSLAVLLFATPLFLHSFLLLSNLLVAVLIYIVFRLLYDARNVALRNNLWAGILSGIVVISDFSAVIAVFILGFGLFFTQHGDRFRRLFFFVSGLLPFAVLLMIYNYAIFGTPFWVFYGAENLDQAIGGFTYPTFSNLYLLLFSPSQGLFFYAPILLFSIIAFFTSREQGTLRKRIKIITILFSIVILACFSAINSDWVFGAKSLIFILPLMLDSFFDGEIEDFPSLWRGFLFAASFLLCTIPALTFPIAPSESKFPHNNFWRPLFFNDQVFSPTILSFFNVPNNIWTILPAILLLLIVIYLVWRNSKFPLNFMLGILSAFIVVGIYLFVPGLDTQTVQQQREIIANERR
jgi:hypothetical protein